MTSTQNNASGKRDIPDNPADTGATVILDDRPGSLIAAVPALLGFTPTDSIVMVGTTGLRQGPETVGPVVRVDTDPESAAAGAAALGRAALDIPGGSVTVIVVSPDGWAMTGKVLDAVAACLGQLHDHAVEVSSLFVVEAIRAGTVWGEIVADSDSDSDRSDRTGDGRGWRPVPGGLVDDPDTSPVAAAGGGTPDLSRTSEQIHRELDPAPVSARLREQLPDYWFTGSGRRSAGEPVTVKDVCALVDRLQGRKVRDELAGDRRLAEVVFETCWRPDLFCVLVVLGAGGHGEVVMALLRETLAVAGPSLRQRALLLTAVTGWCGNYGALGHRAAWRCREEIREAAPDVPGIPDTSAASAVSASCDEAEVDSSVRVIHDRMRGEMLTMTLADAMCAGVADGGTAGLVAEIVDQGVAHLDIEVARRAAAGDTEFGLDVDDLVDEESLSGVRSALARRAGR